MLISMFFSSQNKQRIDLSLIPTAQQHTEHTALTPAQVSVLLEGSSVRNTMRGKKTTLIERSGRAVIAWVTGGHKTSLKLSFQDFLLLLSSFQLVSETCVFSPSRSKYAELAASRSQKRCTHTAPWGTTAGALRLHAPNSLLSSSLSPTALLTLQATRCLAEPQHSTAVLSGAWILPHNYLHL